jgi:hypothetical protein
MVVVNGIRRSEEMQPLLLRSALLNDDPTTPAGFCLIPAQELSLRSVLSEGQAEHWRKLPGTFTFEEALRLMGKSTFSRLKQRTESLGLLLKTDRGSYHKVIE